MKNKLNLIKGGKAEVRSLSDWRKKKRAEKAQTLASRWVPWYRSGDRCDRCGDSSWHVGRLTAECDACGNVLPVAEGQCGPTQLEHVTD